MAVAQSKWEKLGGGIQIRTEGSCSFNEDSLLLAAFSRADRSRRACDLGTGCGILPLLWCRREAPPSITAVEQSRTAYELAVRNVEENGLTERVRVEHADLRDFWRTVRERYDLLTMNPPYFKAGSGASSADPEISAARQDSMASIEEICFSAVRMLHNGGRFCICFPAFRLCDALEAMRANRLEPKRLRLVSARPGSAPRLALVEGVPGGGPGLTVEPEMASLDLEGKRSAAMEEYLNGGVR